MVVPSFHKNAALQMAARYMHRQFPQTVGTAFMELDCGCIKVCGVTESAATVAAMTLALGKGAVKKDRPPQCEACAADKGVNIDRLQHYGIVWPTRKGKPPRPAMRKKIGQKLFGRRYSPGNDSMVDID